MGMCLDKRVLGGLAVAGLGVAVFAPHLLTAMLPILFIAICPLSMLLMGKAMMGGARQTSAVAAGEALALGAVYRCPMHGDVSAAQPGRCPVCGMALAPVTSPQPIDAAYRTAPALNPSQQMTLLRSQLQQMGEQHAAIAGELARLQAVPIETGPTAIERRMEETAAGNIPTVPELQALISDGRVVQRPHA